ncbi:hypothetical protein M8J76_004937 [Diaphorina citri]|nr:hypothetical protein M8J76_004937 [Diaphorina citri]
MEVEMRLKQLRSAAPEIQPNNYNELKSLCAEATLSIASFDAALTALENAAGDDEALLGKHIEDADYAQYYELKSFILTRPFFTSGKNDCSWRKKKKDPMNVNVSV